MSLSLTIAGVDRTSKFWLADHGGEVSGTIMSGVRGSMRIKVYDLVGASGFRPSIDDTLVLTDSVMGDIFAGLIDDIEETSLSDLDTGVVSNLTVSDWMVYLDRVTYTVTYASGTTLKAALQDLVTNVLSPNFGITLDGAQATGATFSTDVSFQTATPVDILGRFTTLTKWIPRITPAKVLSMFAPGSVSAGFSLGDASGNVLGTVGVRRSRNTQYANRVILTCGGSQKVSKSQNFTDPGTAAATFTVDYPASQDINDPWPNQLIVNGVPQGPVAWGPAGSGYYWDYANHRLVRVSGATTFSGQTITVNYTAQFPFEARYDDAAEQVAHKVWEKRGTADAIVTLAEGIAMATAMVQESVALPRQATVRHNAGYCYPGQAVSLSFAERAISATHLITAVDFTNAVDATLEFTITAVPGDVTPSSWLDYFRVESGGGAITITGTVGSPSVVMSGTVNCGGSDRTLVPAGSWTRVPNAQPWVPAVSATLRLRGIIVSKTAGTNVELRYIDDLGVAPIVVPPTASTGMTPKDVTATGTVSGGRAYHLEVRSGTAGDPVSGLAHLENAA